VEKINQRGFKKIHKNQGAILEEIRGIIVLHYAKKMEKQSKFKVKLNDYWMNLYKNLVQ
jgi:hypothetical protein